MQFQSALLLALICTAYADTHPGDLKYWFKVAKWVQQKILTRYQGNVTLSAPVFSGKVFGTVGNSKEGLFEESGYKMVLFNDHRGKAQGQVYQRTLLKFLGIKGVKSDVGVKLRWTKDNAKVNVNLSKPLSGENITITLNGTGNFKYKKNIDVFIKKLNGAFILRG